MQEGGVFGNMRSKDQVCGMKRGSGHGVAKEPQGLRQSSDRPTSGGGVLVLKKVGGLGKQVGRGNSTTDELPG